ncbi:hypothetical protein HDU79_009405 [Rhizoclosmatium sp. JEL0117]|nr:hypothetical protein HDU79_009405 [Rhizoclosmatium sp. JEL0117]
MSNGTACPPLEPSPEPLTILQIITVPLNSFLMGICFEACTVAFFKSSKQLIDILQDRTESPFLTSLIVLFNLGAMISFIFSILIWIPLTESTCVPVDWFSVFIWHFYFIVFNIFVLYKSYIVTDKSQVYLVVAILAFFYRIAWTIVDLMWTGGSWDPIAGVCNYYYSEVTGFHYTIADIICDVVATAGSVTMFLKPENRALEYQSLWFQLMKENVLRSVITLMVNPVVVVMNNAHLDANTMTLVYTAQNYTYVRMMNLEMYFKDQRNSVMLQSRVSNVSAHLNSAGKRSSVVNNEYSPPSRTIIHRNN